MAEGSFADMEEVGVVENGKAKRVNTYYNTSSQFWRLCIQFLKSHWNNSVTCHLKHFLLFSTPEEA